MRKQSANRLLELVMGILLVLLGIFTLFRPGRTLNWLVMLYGAVAIVTGISDIVFYVKEERYTGIGPILSLVTGICSVMAGFMLLVYPRAGRWTMILLFPIWFIAHCISRLTHLSGMRMAMGNFKYYFSLIVNIFGLILGFLMAFSPIISFFTTGFIIGIYLILAGVDMIVAAAAK